MMEAGLLERVALPGTMTVLDAERYIEAVQPLPAGGGSFTLRSRVVGVHKRGKGAVIHNESELRDADGQLIYKLESGSFAVGAKGFTDGGRSLSMAISPPKRAPDAVREVMVGEQQAQIYRLSGDYNPLHIDPTTAEMAGFERPILHGLCSLGFSVRMVLAAYADGDPTAFKAVRCRFSKPVLPGETLVVKMWHCGQDEPGHEAHRVVFTTEVKGQGKLNISNAYVDLTRPAELATPPASKL